MILEYDKKSRIIIFDGDSAWHDVYGNDVTATKQSHFRQNGQLTGIAIDSTGLKTFPVVFTTAYTNVLDKVSAVLTDPTATDAVIGEMFITGDSVTGFTLNVHVITASVTAGSTIKANWEAMGQ